MLLEHQDTPSMNAAELPLAILGGSDKVCRLLADAIQRKKNEFPTQFPEVIQSISLENIDEILDRLKLAKPKERPLRYSEAVGISRLLAIFRLAIDEVLSPLDEALMTVANKNALLKLMQQQESGPVGFDNGGCGFDAEAAIRFFVRLQAIEDVCQ